jgi:hypothetical protein
MTSQHLRKHINCSWTQFIRQVDHRGRGGYGREFGTATGTNHTARYSPGPEIESAVARV